MSERQRFQFTHRRATREQIILRAAFVGKSNSGKSKTAMITACHIAERLGLGLPWVIDSENGSALRYAKSPKTGNGYDFEHVPMPPDDYSPESYIDAIDYCEAHGARVILCDGISQEWTDAPGCVIEQVDELTEEATAAKAARGNNGKASAFSSGWKEMSPRHNIFVQRMLRSSAHFIATMRCKTAYEVDKTGNPKKIGLAPIQRAGVDYEFDLLFQMDDAVLTVGKTRCDRIEPGMKIEKPGTAFADLLVDWLQDVDLAPVRIHPDLAAFVKKVAAADATTEARAELIATMRENREPMPVQTTALAAFDAIVAKRAKPVQPSDTAGVAS